MFARLEEMFEGVSDIDLRRQLVEAGDRRLEARTTHQVQKARGEQALLAAEMERRGVPLEVPRRPGLHPPATIGRHDQSPVNGGNPEPGVPR